MVTCHAKGKCHTLLVFRGFPPGIPLISAPLTSGMVWERSRGTHSNKLTKVINENTLSAPCQSNASILAKGVTIAQNPPEKIPMAST